ncbi:efflux RND transporter periplasmic adaptor subunit [Pseudomonas nitroreducens]|uniref:efflux RND transporter periplasmic adaptor subunit n=1 Tax=Pseudomonas nitroreducens TaxID=46680 RepID=UPI00265AB354|nr:efflux RND transporter periplasmic adaptor subunit [Pseudomonas nitroreducens]MCP1649857.1 RND family efflux transporter MFP subunit [Pseudomonas nitroreducens]MCP1687414.1 RND family efflux transporter MFP subunit [Pseudomonas nitroreducens]
MHKGIWLGLGLSLAVVGVAGAVEPAQDDPLLASPASAGGASDVRGILRARDQAMLSSELAGRILEMPFAEGQSFRKGDVLVRFDCSAYQAQLSAAQAGAKAASEQLAHNRQLAALNSVGRFEVALAEAKLSEAQAQAQVYQVQVRRCSLVAPFDGQVVQRKAQPFESVAGGAPLLEIVDNRSLEIRLLVPSRWVARLKVGQSFTFVPDETGQALQVEIKRLGARIDEGSQMLPLIASLPGDAKGLLAGMSGTARFAETP